nr:unnamed protein product [Trichobilharzia regenti]
MEAPIKLIDEQLKFADLKALQNLFVDNSGFLVVGAIGLQGSGKSSILNILANYISDDCSIFDGPFDIQSVNHILNNSPCTGGVNLYITQDRVILLDAQPLLSFALTNYHIHMATSAETPSTSGNRTGNSSLTGPGKWNIEVWAEMASMQIVAFLVNVCHVVLVVSDNLSTAPTQLHRFVDRAISLKPTVFTPNVIPFHAMRDKQSSNIRKKSSNGTVDCPEVKNLTTAVQRLEISHSNGVTNVPVSNEADDVSELEDDVASLSEQYHQVGSNFPTSNHFLRQCLQSPEAESRDVSNAINRLMNLTDYSASLIHVYNQAPATAFLNPDFCAKLDRYKNKILPLMYPEYRRLMSLVSAGPRILSAHLQSRSPDQCTTAHRNNISNNAPKLINSDTTVIKLSTNNSLGNRIVPDNSVAQGFSGSPDNSSGSSDDSQENSAAATLSALSASNECPEPSLTPSDKDPLSSQKPDDVEDFSPETLVSSEVEDESKTDVAHCLHSPVKSQGKSEIVTTENFDGHKTLNNNNNDGDNNNCTKKFDSSSSNIVSQCCSVLRTIEDELNFTVNEDNSSPDNLSTKDADIKLSELLSFEDNLKKHNLVNTPEINGETLNDSLVKMHRDVHTTRRDFFDVQRRLDKPRLFLIPEVNSKGQTPTGCPTYMTSARILQEAVFSTPRQHMMPNFNEKKWITYAHKMWDAVAHSPLLLDYHSVLMNEL